MDGEGLQLLKSLAQALNPLRPEPQLAAREKSMP